MHDHADMLATFDHQPRTRIVFGIGAVDTVGQHARELQGTTALLVTDPGIIATGHADRVQRSLEAAGLRVVRFGEVRENPTTRDVANCLTVARSAPVDLIVGLGGGSSLDTAKGCNFLLTNGGDMRDYWGVGKATKPMLPLIAIPTTAGTGSECQSFALIANETTHQKMACGDAKAAARVAILDPQLTVTQPRHVAACTGIDALSHAVESAVCRRDNPLSRMYARQAFTLIAGNFAHAMQPDTNNGLDSRGAMLLGAAFAGTAIENAMLGAAHSAANPLTARYNVVHGWAVGIMLPHVIAFNAQDGCTARKYAELAFAAGLTSDRTNIAAGVAALLTHVRHLLDIAGAPRDLAACGVERDAIPTMAEEAAGQWTARFNPRDITANDFVQLYEAAYSAT